MGTVLAPCWQRVGTVSGTVLFWYRIGTVLAPYLHRVGTVFGTVLAPYWHRVSTVFAPCLNRVWHRICTMLAPCLHRICTVLAYSKVLISATRVSLGIFGILGFFGCFWAFFSDFWVKNRHFEIFFPEMAQNPIFSHHISLNHSPELQFCYCLRSTFDESWMTVDDSFRKPTAYNN